MYKTNVSQSYHASSMEEQQVAYDQWAKEYESDLFAIGYRRPAMIAAVLSSGTITPKHAPAHSFDELIRVAIPGGTDCFQFA